jgi:hypothetical protein
MGTLQASPSHRLFADTPIDEAYALLRAKALAAIDELTSEVLLTEDLPRLRQRLVGTYRFRPLLLDWDRRAASEADGGSSLRVFAPFTGAEGLFNMRPTRDDGERPVGWVSEHHLVLVLPADRDEAHREYDRQKVLVTDWVSRINGDVEPLNQRLAQIIRTRVTSDANRLREAVALAQEFGAPPLSRARREAGYSRRTRVAAGDYRRLPATRRRNQAVREPHANTTSNDTRKLSGRRPSLGRRRRSPPSSGRWTAASGSARATCDAYATTSRPRRSRGPVPFSFRSGHRWFAIPVTPKRLNARELAHSPARSPRGAPGAPPVLGHPPEDSVPLSGR